MVKKVNFVMWILLQFKKKILYKTQVADHSLR